MHEFSLVEALVEAVEAELRSRPGARLRAVSLRIGELRQVEPSTMEFCWEAAIQETPLAGARLRIERVEARARCPKCRELVFHEDSETKVKWRAPQPAGEWMKPAGYTAVVIALAGFVATVCVNWGPGEYADSLATFDFVAILAGVLNPLFFIGVPLGYYWLQRCGEIDRICKALSLPADSVSVTSRSSEPHLPPLATVERSRPKSSPPVVDSSELPPALASLVERTVVPSAADTDQEPTATIADAHSTQSNRAEVNDREFKPVWDEVLELEADGTASTVERAKRQTRKQ
ncbi:MAG: hydrogenase maturation nickel metallochaperone HypA [Verrucomicrobiae bacterium]|nr:hydrogenase maturation nickel metallochaperone HypA [Verrucomicrobiae bacterium]